MMIHEITEKAGRYKDRKRVGRGRASGVGKTSGRGHKGAGSRAGFKRRPAFEGGQMPFMRRIPKRGFSNHDFRNLFHIVNVKILNARFQDGDAVDAEALAALGILRDSKLPLKVLGEGEITHKLNVTAAKFSASAKAKIEAAGGTVTEVEKVKWTRAAAGPGKRRQQIAKGRVAKGQANTDG
ncbi:MAG: 50S ribosomal protein L15 [Planctomycetes bacterium]|nr:50S ribosomal protein L15 [Planctomycetota bacterium]